MQTLTHINRTFDSPLPQDAIFPCRIVCEPGSVQEGAVTLDRFFSLYSSRLYASVKGEGLSQSDEIFLTVQDKYSGREIMAKTNVKSFSPGLSAGLESRLTDKDNFRHYFREQAPIKFIAENRGVHKATIDITVLGQRYFTGKNQGSDFSETLDFASEETIGTPGEPSGIEYTYLPKPVSFRFVSRLRDGKFIFDMADSAESGEHAAYKLNPLSRYKLTELSIQTSLPEGVFAGSVSSRFLFNIRSSKNQSMIALPFEFSSHVFRSEVESYLTNRDSDDNNFLIGNLYGEVAQTAEIVRLGYDKLTIVINCVIYEGKENV